MLGGPSKYTMLSRSETRSVRVDELTAFIEYCYSQSSHQNTRMFRYRSRDQSETVMNTESPFFES
jgi:hypothetical protein